MSTKKKKTGNSAFVQAGMAFVGFALMLLILGFITMRGINALNTVTANFSEAVDVNQAKMRLMTVMRDALRNRMLFAYAIEHTEDFFEAESLWEKYTNEAGVFMQAREELLALGLTKTQEKQIEEQKKDLVISGKTLNSLVEKVRNGEKINLSEAYTLAYIKNGYVIKQLEEMQSYQATLSQTAVAQARQAYQNARSEILLKSAVGVWICIIIIVLTIHRIRSHASALDEANAQLEERVEKRTQALMEAQEENMRMGAELNVSNQLQRMLLPKKEELSAIKHLDISGFMEPADEVGGDYYDVLHTGDNQVLFGIGDVTGHGLESGVFMLMAQTAVRTLFSAGIKEPRFFMQILNRTLYDNGQRIGSDKNMTLGLLCHYGNKLYICGQHEDVLVIRKNGEIETVDTFELGFPLGMIEDIEEFISQKVIALEPGDGFVLYTDGITEAFDVGKRANGGAKKVLDPYGLERLCAVIKKNWHLSADEIKTRVIRDLNQHTHKAFDDVTLVVVKQKETCASHDSRQLENALL